MLKHIHTKKDISTESNTHTHTPLYVRKSSVYREDTSEGGIIGFLPA